MIATLWLLSLSTTILFSSIECTYEPNSISDNQLSDSLTEMQDNYLTEKRTKPSLSIINPLEVLRNRLLLELARRHVRENTKQIEFNRAILKNVGKRANQVYRFDYEKHDNDKRNAQIHDDDDDDDDLKIKYLYSLQ